MKHKAFTLVELLVVIAIIGLLATLSIIALNNARAKARDAKRVADIKQISTALELFFNDAGRYPDDLEWASGSLEYNGQTYLAAIPAAPSPADGSCDGTTNQFSYTQTESGASYTISFCTGERVGALSNGGEKCLIPGGFFDSSCADGFICGTDQINITSIAGHTCDESAPYYDKCTYDTIEINGECWMRQNYNVGSIVNGSEDQANNGILEKYCYRHGTNTSDYTNCLAWGALYQWDEAMNHAVTPGAQGICPTGWHLPTEAEYHGLELSLASPPDEANCDGGRDNVYDCDPAATALSVGGSSGFDCALGGYRASNGYFLSGNSICLLFSSELSGGYEISYMAYPGFDIGTRRRLEDSA